jgi:hypothetical protein
MEDGHAVQTKENNRQRTTKQVRGPLFQRIRVVFGVSAPLQAIDLDDKADRLQLALELARHLPTSDG